MFSPNQKNALYKAMELQKANVRSFRIVTDDAEIKITHKPTGFHFRIRPTEGRSGGAGPVITFLYTYYTPSRQGAIFNAKNEVAITNTDSFEKITAHFSNWLLLLKQEFEQPDLWSEMEHEPSLFEDAEIITEERFTDAEIKLLEARVPEIEQQIIDLDLPPDAQAAITAIIRKVPARAMRFTKKELSDALVGSFVKAGFKWQLTTADIGEVWLVSQRFFTLALP
jgi:hypothetical protein